MKQGPATAAALSRASSQQVFPQLDKVRIHSETSGWLGRAGSGAIVAGGGDRRERLLSRTSDRGRTGSWASATAQLHHRPACCSKSHSVQNRLLHFLQVNVRSRFWPVSISSCLLWHPLLCCRCNPSPSGWTWTAHTGHVTRPLRFLSNSLTLKAAMAQTPDPPPPPYPTIPFSLHGNGGHGPSCRPCCPGLSRCLGC